MNMKKGIKQIIAVGTGAIMLGATIVGAMAATPSLANYPSPFIKDGKFDGIMVLGSRAATDDVLGAIDIASSLQYNMKAERTLSYGTGAIDVSGDAVVIKKSSDNLEINEFVRDVKDVLTEDDMSMLTQGTFSNNKDNSDYNHYLRFGDSGKVVYAENEYDDVGLFLTFQNPSDEPKFVFQYELEFENSMESDVISGEAKDFNGQTIDMFGTTYTIVDSNIAANSIKMTLMAGEQTDTMYEYDTKTYQINGTAYEVTVDIISDSSSGGDPSVKFNVNGQSTEKMFEGDTDVLHDGTQIGVREIMPNEGSEVNGRDMVEFYLGSTKVQLEDNNIADTKSYGSVEIESDKINSGGIDFTASITPTSSTDSKPSNVKITNIKYTLLKTRAERGDVYISENSSLRKELENPNAMFGPDWDIQFKGVTKQDSTDVIVKSTGDDQYNFEFTSQEGLEYNIPLLGISATSPFALQLGDEDDMLYMKEKVSIPVDGMFVLNDNSKENNANTRIMKLEDIDTSERKVEFSDLSGDGSKTIFYENSTLYNTPADTANYISPNFNHRANLIVGGDTYSVAVDTTNLKIMVDFNKDGTIKTGDMPNMVVKGGGIVSFNSTEINDADAKLTNGNVSMKLTTTAEDMDEAKEQIIPWVMKEDMTLKEVTMNMGDVTSTNSTGGKDKLKMSKINDVETVMTNYGALVEFDTDASPEQLKIAYPDQQLFAQVLIRGPGEAKTSEGSGTIKYTTITERIPVGTSVLDTSVTDINAQNMIVVGGPCVNSVAAALMGNPANCAEGFSEGNAIVKLVQNGNKVAMIVAGYSAVDSMRAARTISNYQDFKSRLLGSEVNIKGTGLTVTDITAPIAVVAPVIPEFNQTNTTG